MANEQFKSNTLPVKIDREVFSTRLGTNLKQTLPAFAVAAAQTAGLVTIFRRKPLSAQTTADFKVDEVQKETTDIKSLLGTPVFRQLQIQSGQFFELDDVEGENPIEYEGIVMQDILMDVSQSKNIVKTAIQGRDGTVKEYVSQGDYVISIQGNIVGVTNGNTVEDIGNTYPIVDTKRIIEICKSPDSIEVTSEFLQMFGINRMVITDYKFAEKAGFRNIQPFQITALSDTPINLEEL